MTLTSLEICAGAGGSALGFAQAGFHHAALVENDPPAAATLRWNRPEWNVLEMDVAKLDGTDWKGIDLLSGGVPCQPFSMQGKQHGADDERDMFPEALRLAREAQPRAVLLENVPGLAFAKFAAYRASIREELHELGYVTWWEMIHARDHDVPQTRSRFVLVGIREPWAARFNWPAPSALPPPTVGDVLYPFMSSRGWPSAAAWRERAQGQAPTLTGNSGKTGGGPDLGGSRTQAIWTERLSVNGRGIAEEPPGPGETQLRGKGRYLDLTETGRPMLTVEMTKAVQGFPESWHITGSKTHAYRQVANAFPPPAARALGEAILRCLTFQSTGRYAVRRGGQLTPSVLKGRSEYGEGSDRHPGA